MWKDGTVSRAQQHNHHSEIKYKFYCVLASLAIASVSVRRFVLCLSTHIINDERRCVCVRAQLHFRRLTHKFVPSSSNIFAIEASMKFQFQFCHSRTCEPRMGFVLSWKCQHIRNICKWLNFGWRIHVESHVAYNAMVVSWFLNIAKYTIEVGTQCATKNNQNSMQNFNHFRKIDAIFASSTKFD